MTYRWFVRGDWNAFFALLIDNLINIVVFASLLVTGFGFPAGIIFTKMVPGTALGVMVGDLIYTWLAIRLMKKTGRDDVTAMPLGLDTPSTIGMALAVIGPAFLSQKGDLLARGVAEAAAVDQAAHGAWAIGMAVLLVMGAVKVLFSFAGDWVRRHVPVAGLLGSIGGIGLALLSLLPLLEIFEAPIVGLVALGLVLYTLVAKIELPWRLPGAAVAVLAGAALHYGLHAFGLPGAAQHTLPALSFDVALPWPTLMGFVALGDALAYLPIAVPFGLLTIVGGINVSESARAAGDAYATRDVLLTEAVATLCAGLCGGVAQSTPYIGHPAYKQMGARAGYTFATAIVIGLGGIFGYVSFVAAVLPLAAVVPLLLFVGLEITTQAFRAPPERHAPAVAFAFLPILAYLVLIRQDATFGTLYGAVAASAAQLGEHERLVREILATTAIRIKADIVMGLGHGFILTAMLWGSFFSLMIDRALVRAALFVGLCGVFTLCGAIHSLLPSGEMYWPWAAPPLAASWAMGYFVLAALLLGLAAARHTRAHTAR